MPAKTKERAPARARSTGNNKHFDAPKIAMPDPGLSSTTYAALVLTRRYGIRPQVAALVADLAMIGGAA